MGGVVKVGATNAQLAQSTVNGSFLGHGRAIQLTDMFGER